MNKLKALIGIIPLLSSTTVTTTPNSTSIENSNVAYDLRCIFGGDHPESFDLNTLCYNKHGEELYENFDMLKMKSVGSNLYAYFRVDNTNLEYLKDNTTYAFQITKVFKDDSISSDTYKCRYLDKSYGISLPSKPGSTFCKVAFDNILTSDIFSISIDSFGESYTSLENVDEDLYRQGVPSGEIVLHNKTMYQINQKIELNNKNDDITSNDDFMFKYFGTEVVNILDKEVGSMLTLNNGYFLPKDECYSIDDFYCFFYSDLDYDIQDLLSVVYQYQVTNYKYIHYDEVYNGSVKDINPIRKESLSTLSSDFKVENMKKGTTSHTVHYNYCYFWDKDISYNVENIQNCNDLSNLKNTGYYTKEDSEAQKDKSLVGQPKPDENFKKFIEKRQKLRTQENKSNWSWAFRLESLERTNPKNYLAGETYLSGDIGMLILNQRYLYDCYLSDIDQVSILKLQYKDYLGVEHSVNAIDEPTDSSFIEVYSYAPYTITDLIVDTVKDIGNGFKKFLIIFLSIVLGLVLFILIFKLVSWILSLRNKNRVNKLYKESKAKEKEEKKKNKK